jgi:hypothetical protein
LVFFLWKAPLGGQPVLQFFQFQFSNGANLVMRAFTGCE